MELITKEIFTLGNSIYLLTSNALTWGNAQTEADEDFGGNLVTINNAREQTFLAGLFAGEDLWIGYNDAGEEGTFIWSSGEAVGYENWEVNQPNNGNNAEDFAFLQAGNGSWNDGQGSSPLSGIIEISEFETPILVIEDKGILEPSSGSQEALFTVRLFGSSEETITVNYSTENDTAVAGIDYEEASDTLTFAPGETEQTISVSILSDSEADGGEEFFLNLSDPTNAILGDDRAQAVLREPTEAFTFKGKTYLLTENAKNWGKAQVEATTYGGQLGHD